MFISHFEYYGRVCVLKGSTHLSPKKRFAFLKLVLQTSITLESTDSRSLISAHGANLTPFGASLCEVIFISCALMCFSAAAVFRGMRKPTNLPQMLNSKRFFHRRFFMIAAHTVRIPCHPMHLCAAKVVPSSPPQYEKSMLHFRQQKKRRTPANSDVKTTSRRPFVDQWVTPY